MWTLLLMMSGFALRGQESAPVRNIQGPLAAEGGDTCVVCYGRCERGDVVYLVDGQRFAVMKVFEKQFLDDPEPYIRLYKPNSIQFTSGSAGISDRYLILGLLALMGMFAAGFLTHRMVMNRSRGAFVPAGLGKIPLTKTPVDCAGCGGENHPSAKQCLHCGGNLTPAEPSEVERA
jgi:hypothetical protein